jgi:hypothetical protein
VEAIRRNSNFAHLSNKWSDLRKRVDESLPRQTLLYQDKPKSRTKRFLSANDITDIITRYNTGNTTQHIATHYGISKTRVATILRDHGIAIRRQGLTTKQLTEAAALYAAGQSLAHIGARFGVSHTTVAAALRREGIRLRNRPGWS